MGCWTDISPMVLKRCDECTYCMFLHFYIAMSAFIENGLSIPEANDRHVRTVCQRHGVMMSSRIINGVSIDEY